MISRFRTWTRSNACAHPRSRPWPVKTARYSSRCSTSAIWPRSHRLIVCRNHELAKERVRKREALLGATEKELTRAGVADRINAVPIFVTFSTNFNGGLYVLPKSRSVTPAARRKAVAHLVMPRDERTAGVVKPSIVAA